LVTTYTQEKRKHQKRTGKKGEKRRRTGGKRAKGRKEKRLEATNSTLVGAAIGKNSILNNSMNMLSWCFSSST